MLTSASVTDILSSVLRGFESKSGTLTLSPILLCEKKKLLKSSALSLESYTCVLLSSLYMGGYHWLLPFPKIPFTVFHQILLSLQLAKESQSLLL